MGARPGWICELRVGVWLGLGVVATYASGMATFDLQTFVASPSLEILDKCRKDDLLAITVHYDVQIVKQFIKKDIRSKVIVKLRDLGVLGSPPPVDTTTVGESDVEKVVTPLAGVSGD